MLPPGHTRPITTAPCFRTARRIDRFWLRRPPTVGLGLPGNVVPPSAASSQSWRARIA